MTDRWSLDGRVAIVAGAGRGLGRGCARALAEAGARVLLVSRTEAEIIAAASELGGAAHVADVTDPAQLPGILEAASRLGDARVLVNAAGTNRTGPARDYAIADWDALFDVNVRATFLVSQAFGDDLLTPRRPRVDRQPLLADGHRRLPRPRRLLLDEARGRGHDEGARRSSGRRRASGSTPSRRPSSSRRSRSRCSTTPSSPPRSARRLPTGELATIEQVADAVRYLACDASGSVTGTILRVDGGWTAW